MNLLSKAFNIFLNHLNISLCVVIAQGIFQVFHTGPSAMGKSTALASKLNTHGSGHETEKSHN